MSIVKHVPLTRTEITPLTNENIYIDYRIQSYLSSPYHVKPTLHAHPETQLVYIVSGFGKKFIGDKVELFAAGEMVLVGPNIPHLWLSDKAFYDKKRGLESKVLIVYFNQEIFGPVLENVKEFRNIHETILLSSRGLNIFGETKRQIAEKLFSLINKTGYEKAAGLLQVLDLIAGSAEKNFILDKELTCLTASRNSRLSTVIRFINDNISEDLSLKKVAGVACMTEQSFCRFFKKRTNKSLVAFINDLRIEKAKDLLTSSNKPIADIAFSCGYNSLSHFYKLFKESANVTPLQYQEMFHGIKTAFHFGEIPVSPCL